jgi:hypothetical protein
MAQNETYITTVYQEQGGNKYVAGSGGAFAVESGGSIGIYSGAQMTVESGGNLALAGANLAGDDARRILVSELGGTVIIGQGATSTVLSIVNLPKNVRTVLLSGTSTMIAGSFWLTSVSAGREVFLMFGGGSTSTASGVVTVSCSGCSLLGSVGTAISGFQMNMSASHCAILLRAVEDNVWAVVSQYGDIDD